MGVSFESALRMVAEAPPAEASVEAIAVAAADVVVADTEKIVAQSGTGLHEMMLMDDIDTVDQKENADSEGVGLLLADWVKAEAACNTEVVVWFESHLRMELEMARP